MLCAFAGTAICAFIFFRCRVGGGACLGWVEGAHFMRLALLQKYRCFGFSVYRRCLLVVEVGLEVCSSAHVPLLELLCVLVLGFKL